MPRTKTTATAQKPKPSKAMPSIVDIDGITYTLHMVDCSKETGNGHVSTGSKEIERIVTEVEKGKICRDVLIQRTDDQWNKKQKSLLISSILKNRPIGTILLTGKGVTEDQNYAKYSLIDGLQRVTTICDFVGNHFTLDKNLAPLQCRFRDEDGNYITHNVEIAGKKFEQLPVVLQDKILGFEIPVNRYEGFTDEELDEIVFCTNNGTSPKIGQKIRFTLGTHMMKYIQPICDGTFWEKAKGCKAKNDTILIAVMRSLAILTGHDCKSYGTAEILAFAQWYSENGSVEQIENLSELFEQLDSLTNRIPEEEWEFFDACNIPHLIMNLDKFNSMDNPERKTYKEFIEHFIHSTEYETYKSYCRKTGSGGMMYSIENSDERQFILDNCLDEFLDCSVNSKEEDENDGDNNTSEETDSETVYEDTETAIYDSILAEDHGDSGSGSIGLSTEEFESVLSSA